MTTDTGNLILDADANSNNNGGNDRLDIAERRFTLTSESLMTLDATTEGIRFAGVGGLQAKAGITINNAVTATTLGTVTIDADSEDDGTEYVH